MILGSEFSELGRHRGSWVLVSPEDNCSSDGLVPIPRR